jgi:hypothetical protein
MPCLWRCKCKCSWITEGRCMLPWTQCQIILMRCALPSLVTRTEVHKFVYIIRLILYSRNHHSSYQFKYLFQNIKIHFHPRSQNWEKALLVLSHLPVSFPVSPSVRMEKDNTGGIFMKFLENLSRKFNFHNNLTRITGTLQ